MTTEEREKQNEVLTNKIQEFCKEIYPYVDSIRVFVTKHESNEIGTTRYDYGLGNWFAQYGQVMEWSRTVDFLGEGEE